MPQATGRGDVTVPAAGHHREETLQQIKCLCGPCGCSNELGGAAVQKSDGEGDAGLAQNLRPQHGLVRRGLEGDLRTAGGQAHGLPQGLIGIGAGG